MQFEWNSKYLSCTNLRLRERWLIALWHGFCLLRKVFCFYFSVNTDTCTKHVKEIPRNLHIKLWRLDKKSFFLKKIHDGSRNIFVNRSKRNCCSIFLINLPKHVQMGWRFQKTLKSTLSFILKHVFMYLTHFIQVA